MATVSRVTRIVGLSKTTIYRMIEEGTFPKPVMVGRRALWPFTRLESWTRQQVAASPDKRFDEAA
ncbi:MAG TPA: AlpA family phage regulatory protein [Thermomonas sp.]|nr:AlpA family phage regulatory protein [Thermomonas sp.]